MKEANHLKQYRFVLKVIGPVFVGSGSALSKVEYCYFSEKKSISVLDDDRFINFLIDRNLDDSFENFMTREGRTNGAELYRGFLRPHEVTYEEISSFTKYRIKVGEGLDSSHSLKEVRNFIQTKNNEPYIPGSSVKGALRTAILTQILLDKGWSGPIPDRNSAQVIETECLNKLQCTTRKEDSLNCIMRGLSISDSAPISRKYMRLYRKTDLYPGPLRNVKSLNVLRECLEPGTEVIFSLNIDTSVCKEWDGAFLYKCMNRQADFFKEAYLKYFPAFRGKLPPSGTPLLWIGGGSGYFSKNILYPALGMSRHQEAVRKVADLMQKKFSGHRHWNDLQSGISPRMLKIAEMGDMSDTLVGLCEGRLIQENGG